MVRLEKTHGLKFFRHLDPQEKVRGEGTHFKVPWVTWKLRRWGGGLGETLSWDRGCHWHLVLKVIIPYEPLILFFFQRFLSLFEYFFIFHY